MKIALNSLKLHLDFNMAFARALTEDVPDEKMCNMPSKGLENHPAWTIGHLVTGAGLTAKLLGEDYGVSEDWDALFRRTGPGDPAMPSINASDYPPISALLHALNEQHEKIKRMIDLQPATFWSEEKSWRFAHRFACRYDLIAFLIMQHESMHLGQLNAWRRAMGYDSAFAKL